MSALASRWLTAWVGDVPVAFPLEEVRQIILWVPWQAAPPGRPGLAGVLSLRGEAWPVWDIGRAWGWTARAPGPDTSLVLARREDGSHLGAFVVDRSGWVVTAEPRATGAADAAGAGFTRTIVDPDSGTEHFVMRLAQLVGGSERVGGGA